MASSLNPGKRAYFTRKEVARVLGVLPSPVYRWAKAKRLPEPIVLGPNRTVWKISEIVEWMESCEESRGFKKVG